MPPVTHSTVRVLPLEDGLRDSYLRFAATTFGPRSYQANPAYLDWLYRESPLTRGEGDCRLAVQGTKVVGCIHVMRTSWRWRGEAVVVPALHNTMVEPAYRGGAGGLLIAQAFRGEAHAFVPGAVGAVANILHRLGFAPVPVVSCAKWLRPVTGTVRIALHRVLGEKPGGPSVRWPQPESPSAVELEEMSALAGAGGSGTGDFVQDWTPRLMRWRFFHDRGPRHLHVLLREGGALAAFGIISLGIRQGILLARVVDWRAAEERHLGGLLDAVARAAATAGAYLVQVGCGDPRLGDWLARAGWRRWENRAETSIYHRDRKTPVGTHRFMLSAGDYGLESFPSAAGTA